MGSDDVAHGEGKSVLQYKSALNTNSIKIPITLAVIIKCLPNHT